MAITEEENRTLTEVGPGTPMGDLLRRYWHPIAAVDELEEYPAKPVRLLGEDLVLYKDGNGNYGLIERWCAHRGTDLCMGIVEEYGIRCARHGWLYGETGQCLDMPMEEESFADRVKLKGYAVAEKGGMLWGYLGPLPAPLVPDWEPFSWEDGIVQIVFTPLTCNWLQCQENTLDPVELEWLQDGIALHALGGPAPERPRDVDFEYDEFDHGFLYLSGERGAPANPRSIGRVALWPNALFTGDERSCRFEWRVPMNDTTTWNVAWFFERAAPGADLPEKQRFHWYAPTKDDDEDPITSHLLNRKFTIWMHQPAIVDRSKEYLTQGDRGIVMYRDKLFSQIALIADGGEPKAVLRDPEANRRLTLPFVSAEPPPVIIAPKVKHGGYQDDASQDQPPPEPPPPPVIDHESFPYVAGQPDDAAEAYQRVRRTWLEGNG
ncbi:MAG TPA: Rieske 2Fe-2S domain-containing protein [Dehalococcoidia bacterium]|nr:Rieske 2Fe-2S domain-containing protein [Dehalococcoidia bacterium]